MKNTFYFYFYELNPSSPHLVLILVDYRNIVILMSIYILTNRLSLINGLIPLDWLNKSLESFKFMCKKQFMWKKTTLIKIIST